MTNFLLAQHKLERKKNSKNKINFSDEFYACFME